MYYTKKEVESYFKEKLSMIETDQEKYRVLSTAEELAQQFNNDEDKIAIFWTIHEGNQISMDGKAFVMIEPDLYTDDRYALDCALAVEKGTTVGQIIRDRAEKQREAKEALENSNTHKLQEIYKDLG